MNTKIERNFEIEYSLNWTWGVEISQMRKDLDAIEKLGATHVNIESSMCYDQALTEIEAYAQRFETDEEMNERISKEQHRINQQKQEELYQLKRLKAKYEQ